MKKLFLIATKSLKGEIMKIKILLLLFIVIAGVSLLAIPKARAMSAAKENSLGDSYYSGQGVKQSYSKALYWYKKAAEQGNINAENNLSYVYLYGKGIKYNSSKAIYWCRKAVAQGNANAEYNLGLFYAFGWSVEPNKSKALYWYKKAAEQGIPPAEYILINDGAFEKGAGRHIRWFLPKPGKRYHATGYKSLKAAEMYANETLQEKAANILDTYETNVMGMGNHYYVSGQSEHNYKSGQYKYTFQTIIIITGNKDSVAGGATISGINFSSQLQSSLLSYLQGTGYKNDINANTAMSFLMFISNTKSNIANIFVAAVAINNMINTSDFKDFNKLTKLYAQYIIKKNS
jgi:hypothetical protein